MPLRVELKPFERIVIGESVITNSDTRTTFLIDGDAPILREKDILTARSEYGSVHGVNIVGLPVREDIELTVSASNNADTTARRWRNT